MRITYSKNADAAYIYLTDIKKGGVAKTHPCEVPGIKGEIMLDFDKDGRLVGIEILDASNGLPASFLKSAENIG